MLTVLHENLLYKTSTRHRKNSKQSKIVTIDSCFAIIVAYQCGVTNRESSVEKYPHTLILALLNQGRIQEFLIGGSKLWFAKDCSTFLCQITFPPHPLPPVAEKAEMTMSFSICELFWRVLISLEFSLVAKCNTHFIKKKHPVKKWYSTLSM